MGGTTPYVWTLDSGTLPAGFSLDSGSGVISGMTNESGLWSFTVRITDSTPDIPGTYTKDFNLQIDPALALQITNVSLVAGQADIAYVETVTATGGTEPYAFSVDAGMLPSGITLTTGGILSGVPEEPGNYALVIKVTDSTTPAALPATSRYSKKPCLMPSRTIFTRPT
jgi:hypothetical protein